MTFGIVEAAGGLGVGLLVSAVGQSAKKYSTVPEDVQKGNEDMQLVFDALEKYGHAFEPEVREEVQERYKDLLEQKDGLQTMPSSLKRFLPAHRQSCYDFRRKAEELKDAVTSRSQEARYTPTILKTPIPEQEERAEEADEADSVQKVDCTT